LGMNSTQPIQEVDIHLATTSEKSGISYLIKFGLGLYSKLN